MREAAWSRRALRQSMYALACALVRNMGAGLSGFGQPDCDCLSLATAQT